MKRLVLPCSFLVLAASCSDDSKPLPAATHAALETYANIALATYEDSDATADAMLDAVNALTASPADPEAAIAAARTAWLTARNPYLQSETFRFAEGPIDLDDGNPEGLINSWPVNEAGIDYVVGAPSSGIVNATTPITADALEAANGAGGEDNITVGYHAIEFLLWGQDLSATGPGARPGTDYTTAANAGRRGEYLKVATELLAGHLHDLIAAWEDGNTTNYRAQYLGSMGDREALRRAFTGLVTFTGGEIGGDRLTAITTHDQEDEHSCFSDNTRQDFIEDVQGVYNVWHGSYLRADGTTTVSGPGLRDIVVAVDSTLASTIDTDLDTAVAASKAVHQPYDQEILTPDGITRLEALRSSLQKLHDDFSNAMIALGLPTAS